jgi:hydroxypyruvate isomerase
MPKLKQSFCLQCFHREGADVAQLLRGAGEIGYAAVEMWARQDEPVPLDEFVNMAREAGLAVASMCGHATLRRGFNNPDNHAALADEVAESIDLAARYGIPGLICFSGLREGRDDERSIDVCARGLKRVVKLAEEKGVNLNLELLNSKRDHPDYQCDHTAWGVRVCKAVDSPRMKLLYDIYHMQIMEGDIIATIRESAAYIGHFHTAGNPGRGPLDETQELNYSAICRAIVDSGYNLYVGQEFWGEGEPLELLRAAFRTCDVG